MARARKAPGDPKRRTRRLTRRPRSSITFARARGPLRRREGRERRERQERQERQERGAFHRDAPSPRAAAKSARRRPSRFPRGASRRADGEGAPASFCSFAYRPRPPRVRDVAPVSRRPWRAPAPSLRPPAPHAPPVRDPQAPPVRPLPRPIPRRGRRGSAPTRHLSREPPLGTRAQNHPRPFISGRGRFRPRASVPDRAGRVYMGA